MSAVTALQNSVTGAKEALKGTNGAAHVTLSSSEDTTAGVIKVEQRFSYTPITTAATTVVKASAGFFHGIVINKAVATGVITIYDNTSAAGTKIGTITFGASLLSDPPIVAPYNVSFATGLTIVTSAATDLTVAYR